MFDGVIRTIFTDLLLDYDSKILVVEDEPAVRDMIVFVLTQTEFQVQQAVDAAKRRKNGSQSPDIILMTD